VLAMFVLSLVAAGTIPLERFVQAHPASRRIVSPDGKRLVHASGFLSEATGRPPADAARAFLAAHGAAFGVTARQVLVLEGAPVAGRVSAVHFRRTIDGLPIFGGDLVVGVDVEGRVFVVNGADVSADVSGQHVLGENGARRAAVASFPEGVQGETPVAVAAGWSTFGPSMRAVYRVDFIARNPVGDWRVFVDAETGRMLFRENLRFNASAPGSVFEVSPVETAASVCTLSGNAHTFCANPINVTLPNLVTGADLTGTQTSVFNCKGADVPAAVPGTCSAVPAVGGAFNFALDSTYKSTTDDFAAPMAYYHLDKHVSFFKHLDPALPSGTGRAIKASLPAIVNVFQGGAPFENAQYNGLLDAMVFGQGATADFAYDATVMYHEFTHGVVSAWGGFNPTMDALGGVWEPKGLNEGTADAMAASENGRSLVGSFLTATGFPAGTPGPFLRDLSDPNASRTCQGDGTSQAAGNGLQGEEHADGEIWNGFYWEVYQGLKAAGIKGCSGTCEAGPALQYKALQLSAGTSPLFNGYWQTFKAAATASFPPNSGVAAYVDCVARRRKLDQCDRTVHLYAGERKAQEIKARFSPFQVVLETTAASSQFSVCSGQGKTTTIYVRKDVPALITAIDPNTQAATITADASAPFTQACPTLMTFTLNPAAKWYLLLDAGSTATSDGYRIDAGTVGVTSRPAAAVPQTCSPPVLTATPPSASVAPKGIVTFTATGGSGVYSWSVPNNASKGTIDAATGAYTAGATGGVTDVVQVTDSFSNTATANITISPAPASSSAGGGGCGTTSVQGAPALLLGLAILLRRHRQGTR
jgi:Zn-dependent metalloprotease